MLETRGMSIYNIDSTLTNLRAYPNNFWSSLKSENDLNMGTLISAHGIMTSSSTKALRPDAP